MRRAPSLEGMNAVAKAYGNDASLLKFRPCRHFWLLIDLLLSNTSTSRSEGSAFAVLF
jgi:hypothetical protein